MKIGFQWTLDSLFLSEKYDDYNFILQPYLHIKEYMEFYKQSKKTKILDNTANEGFTVNVEDMFNSASKVNADIIVIQDFLLDYKNTKNVTEKWIEYIKTHHLNNDYEYMGVIQGSNPDEFIKMYEYLKSFDFITYIGVPNIIYTTNFYNEVFNYISKDNSKKIHQLGMRTYNIFNYKFLYSFDTSLPINYAYYLYKDIKTYKKFKGVKIVDRLDLDDEKLKIIDETINFLRTNTSEVIYERYHY